MNLEETARKIRTMEIRGAGRIARHAAKALYTHSMEGESTDLASYCQRMNEAADLLVSTRPTAVSLPNAINLVMKPLKYETDVLSARQNLEERALAFVKRSEEAVSRIGTIGARHIRDGDVILTHCNSEAALACILKAHKQGMTSKYTQQR